MDLVRTARPPDASAMAGLAAGKRQQYRENAFPFQRPSEGARELHEPFLISLTEQEGFIAVVHEASGMIDGFIVARVGAAPPPFGEGPLVHVDDFVVSRPDTWQTTGRALLDEVARQAVGAGAAKAIVVSGDRSIDAPKNDFLKGYGLVCEAEWWVKPIEPREAELPDEVGSAPSSARRHRCTTRADPHALRSRSTDRSAWVSSRSSRPQRDR